MARITSLHVKPKQSLGQNFLIDDNIARKIVGALNLSEQDVVVEIGPGKGALTTHLVETARHLIAVEVDGRILDDLRSMFHSSTIVILHQDFLETDLAKWQNEYQRKLRVVGNIPYHLTSSILFKVFEERLSVDDLTITVQREVAQRIAATLGTKEYGILSVFSRFYGTPKILFTVSPHCFYPKPKVTSAVVHLKLRERLLHDVNEQTFATVVKTTFGKRRKTLRNSLKYLPYEEATVNMILKKIDFPVEKRPEQLTVDQFVRLSEQIDHIITDKSMSHEFHQN
jgi:16S rRNA (adenine1518-N6/adenine1519-N6)-dimethyltransferase